MTRSRQRSIYRTPTSLGIAAVLMSVCPALAVSDQSQDRDATDSLLAGPAIGEESTRPTLVQRDFSGEFQRLDRHPAEAAFELVIDRYDVEVAARDAVADLLHERRMVLDELVIDRLDLLIKLSNGGDERDRARAIAALRQALAPISRRGTLGDRIRAQLPPAAAEEHARLEREYMQAVIEHRVAMLEAENPDARQRGLRLRAQAIEILVSLGAEVRRAYERTLVQDGERLDAMIRVIGLTPQQEGKVRRIIGEYAEKTLINKQADDTRAGRFELFVRVAAELTPEQRRRLMEYTRGER